MRTGRVAPLISSIRGLPLTVLLQMKVKLIVYMVGHLLCQGKYNHERGIVVLCAYLLVLPCDCSNASSVLTS